MFKDSVFLWIFPLILILGTVYSPLKQFEDSFKKDAIALD